MPIRIQQVGRLLATNNMLYWDLEAFGCELLLSNEHFAITSIHR